MGKDQQKEMPISKANELEENIDQEKISENTNTAEVDIKSVDKGISEKKQKRRKNSKEGKKLSLKEKLKELKKEKDDYKDRYIRKLAEFDNYRKRIEKEREEYYCFPTADVIKLLLPVIDSFECALKMECQYQEDKFKEGMELIYRQMLDILQSLGLESIPALGEQFDPNVHQAVDSVDTNDYEDNQIIEEMQTGYMFRNKLIRASLVKVAINKEEQEISMEEEASE